MAAVSLPNPPVEPNYDTLAARYDSDDDEEAFMTHQNPSGSSTLDGQSAEQQPSAAAPAAAPAANGHSETAATDKAAATAVNSGPAEYDDMNEEGEQGWEEDSDEGDDDELYAALEWADSREGVC
jgi:hypothetical protein